MRTDNLTKGQTPDGHRSKFAESTVTRNPYRAAKPYLARWRFYSTARQTAHICTAIDMAVNATKIGAGLGAEAKKHIEGCLYPYSTAQQYIHQLYDENAQFHDIQVWRHAWLEHLANEWDENARLRDTQHDQAGHKRTA